MDLPPELLDEIISYIPPHDERLLRNCSLVANSWVYPSRRRIFKAVDIWRNPRLELWLDAISPTNVEILQHVRSLTFNLADAPDSPRPSADLINYLPSFIQLECLTLQSGSVPVFTQIDTYSAFQHTLLYLSLRCCHVAASALVTIVDYFPNLAHLELADPSHMVDGQPALPFSRPLQKLTFTELYTDSGLAFLDQLMVLRPQCDEVTIGRHEASCPSLAQSVVNGVEACVKRLRLESMLSYSGEHLTLSDCRELRELEISVFRPGPLESNLISSITSTNIQRITFTRPLQFKGQQAVDDPDWTRLDDSLCRLVDRLKCGPQLEVGFLALNAQQWWSGELGFKKCLPRFYEKGETGVGRGK